MSIQYSLIFSKNITSYFTFQIYVYILLNIKLCNYFILNAMQYIMLHDLKLYYQYAEI